MEKPKLYIEEVALKQGADSNFEEKREERVATILYFLEKINGLEELSFPGIHPAAYIKMKATDDEYPGFTTPTDEIIRRCKERGIKVVTGKHPGSGNIFVLPVGSNDIEMDSLALHQLDINGVRDENLRDLILLIGNKTKS